MRKFTLTFLLILATVLAFTVLAMGFNSITGDVSVTAGFGYVAGMFGGLSSFWGLIVAAIALGLAVWGFNHIANKIYEKPSTRMVHVGIAVAALVAAGVIGHQWFRWPSGAGWITLGALGVLIAVTSLVMFINRGPQQVPAPKQQVSAPTPNGGN